MNDSFSRSELLWGQEFQEKLKNKHILIVGLGGVGSFACEALARSGVGQLTIIDFDEVSESNINRQLYALNSTLGQKKTNVAKQRCKDINPQIKINIINDFYNQELNPTLFENKIDFVVDAIDTLRSKIELLEYCYKNQIPAISSLGTGNRLIPEALEIMDLKDLNTKKCIFTKNVHYQLNKRGITEGIKFVTSKENPTKVEKVINIEKAGKIEYKKITPASVSFVPPVSGYIMAGHIIRSFLNE